MTRASFDTLVTTLDSSLTTVTERELLDPTHWQLGEDARLREDVRFRETRWGRWMLAWKLVANDEIYRWLHAERRSSVALERALRDLGMKFGRDYVFCAGDPRFVLRGDDIRLAAGELSNQPVVEDNVSELERYRTHLPLHSLRAAAASAPAGEWGQRAQDQVIETLGWVRVSLPGRRLNERMFIAAIEGHSMDDGRSGLVDGGHAVFELWPSGSRKNKSVLVRGAFSDPETGSYAVKKYVADQRDAEGRHHKVSLVSLNPDKARYPDIELQAERDDITVVARVVQALSTDDYECRPKVRRRVGRRTLTAEAQAARLGRQAASFFEGSAPDAEDGDATDTGANAWAARLVCLDGAAGGLHLEVGPLDGLPSFVKKLRVVGSGGWDAFILAANARSRSARVAVRPGAGPWRWEAVGFEGEEELGLERLAFGALAATAPIVFRIDADGVGQHTGATTLSLGQTYRLLLPPGVGSDVGDELDGDWRLWALDLAMPLSPTTRQRLTSLGLDVGESWPRLEWALTSATAWRTNARGDSYPAFEVDAELLVNASGIEADDGDEVALFLHGPSGTERLPLGSSGLVSLGAPAPGRWVCALLHSRTSVKSSSVPFEVVGEASDAIEASFSVDAPKALTSLAVTAPPGWPVALRWRGLAASEESLATVYADEDGSVPVDGAASFIEARAARTRIADLIVDFGELGRRVIEHDGRASLTQVREQLTNLWQQRSGLVQARGGAWLQLKGIWFEPVTELLGYGLEDAALLVDPGGSYDLAAWTLTVDERTKGSITRSPSRVLVLTTDVDAVLHDHRAWVDSACSAANVRDAIITDGARWISHRRGSHQLTQEVWSLEEAISLGRIDDMLRDLAEGL